MTCPKAGSAFYLPGSHSEILLRVNYWLDAPDTDAGAVWMQAWSAASAQGAQPLPGIGDSAFSRNGRLSFRKQELFVTLTAVETDWNLGASSGRDKQLALEMKIAEDMIAHFQ